MELRAHYDLHPPVKAKENLSSKLRGRGIHVDSEAVTQMWMQEEVKN